VRQLHKQKVQIKVRKDTTAMFVAEDYEPLPPGLYVGKLLDIESRESANGEYRRWSWEILNGQYAGQKVYANSSTNFGPQAKARQWVENILGRELEAGRGKAIRAKAPLAVCSRPTSPAA
jgi:hypothetical protein